MNIIKKTEDIENIKNYFLNKGEKEEYFLFDLSINSGISISKLLSLKKGDLLIDNNTIKSTLTMCGRDYFLTTHVKHTFLKLIQYSENEYLFSNYTQTNCYDRSQFYKKLKHAEKELKLDYCLSNKVCELTFAYHYLIQYGDVDYLMRIFKKNRKRLIVQLFNSEDNDKELFHL